MEKELLDCLKNENVSNENIDKFNQLRFEAEKLGFVFEFFDIRDKKFTIEFSIRH